MDDAFAHFSPGLSPQRFHPAIPPIMATNNVPKPIAELLDLGQFCLNGINAYGESIGLLQYTDANFRPLVTALDVKQAEFNASRSYLADLYSDVHLQVAGMRVACLTGRKILSISWGDDWSPEWVQGGWTDASTAVPTSGADLEELCTALKTFLTGHPDYVVNTARVQFVATRYANLVVAHDYAQMQLANAKVVEKQAKLARSGAEKALRDAIRGLIDVLAQLLGPDDPRWEAFGLNQPGATVTPGQPTDLVLSVSGPGKILAACSAVPLATYYRWFSKLEGVDTEFQFGGRTSDPMKEFPGQPATGTLQVKVAAANEAGPGVASAVASITFPEV